MPIKKNYDWTAIQSMSPEQRRAILPVLAKAANTRLAQLEKHGYTETYAYAHVSKLLHQEKPRFSRSTKLTNTEINKELMYIEDFLSKKSSTLTGRRAIDKKRIETLKSSRQNRIGISMPSLNLNNANIPSFFDFLQSQNYKEMLKKLNSGDIQELWINSYNEGISTAVVENEFKNFINNEISYDELKTILEEKGNYNATSGHS